ncbi:MAG: undecaprenyl-diphosphatase UppP [Desulfobulbaceae bacterium]|nr:undecaprenyl-diphosphatase UppP [Desulfobulbaceae bacterium]
MNILYAIFLGLLQGATEFLPVSSSGHLVLAESFFGVEEASLAFDVVLHLGTLIAVLIYFRVDFWLMAKALLAWQDKSEDTTTLRALAMQLAIGTVPAVVAALLIGDYVENTLRHPMVVAVTLAGVGLFLLIGERVGQHRRNFSSITWLDTILIGCAQALAIIPGVSRSGITMTAGLFRGLNREATARFSFLLSAPIICGAGVYKVPEIMHQGLTPGQGSFYLAGFLSAAVSGYFVIAFLLRFIRTKTFDVFAYYRFALAALVALSLLLH